MKARRLFACFCVSVLSLGAASPALALVPIVFVSRSGNNANACNNINTPCQTFAGAVTKLYPSGEVIVLDSGDYGSFTITKGVTIEAPAGVTAYCHPISGDAITINAGPSDVVTLRGLVLNGGVFNGITVKSVGTLNLENCFITGFNSSGIEMLSAGQLNVKGTDIKACYLGVAIQNTTGLARVSIDHCHLDGNFFGFNAATTTPGSSTTTATYSSANNNSSAGWLCGNGSNGKDVLNLEFCTGSENTYGLYSGSTNALSVVSYSNCVFANNGTYGVYHADSGYVQTRGNNTITGNVWGPTLGTIGTFSPM